MGPNESFYQQERDDVVEEKGKIESMLAATVKAFGIDHVLSMINWTNSSFTKEEFVQWWKEYQELEKAFGR